MFPLENLTKRVEEKSSPFKPKKEHHLTLKCLKDQQLPGRLGVPVLVYEMLPHSSYLNNDYKS